MSQVQSGQFNLAGEKWLLDNDGYWRVRGPSNDCCCGACCNCRECCFGPGDCLFATLVLTASSYDRFTCFLQPPCHVTTPGYVQSNKFIFCGCFPGDPDVCPQASTMAVFRRLDLIPDGCDQPRQPPSCSLLNDPPITTISRMPYLIAKCCADGAWYAYYPGGNSDCITCGIFPTLTGNCQCSAPIDCSTPLGGNPNSCLPEQCHCRVQRSTGCNSATIRASLKACQEADNLCHCTEVASKTISIDVLNFACSFNANTIPQSCVPDLSGLPYHPCNPPVGPVPH